MSENENDLLLYELQLLISMYDPSQVQFDDVETRLKVENGHPISTSVSLTITPNEFLQLSLRLPQGYPKTERLSASCQINKKGIEIVTQKHQSNSDQVIQTRFNSDLSIWLKNDGESTLQDKSLLGVVQWVCEKWEELLTQTEGIDDDDSKNDESKTDSSCRIWIHSHHIYNEKKRKFIIDTANSLGLKGFSRSGKPGFICVQGDEESCDDFWTQIRQLSWQKISLIERQVLSQSQNETVFSTFEELRLDMSGFIKYLEEKGLASVIKDYLGFG